MWKVAKGEADYNFWGTEWQRRGSSLGPRERRWQQEENYKIKHRPRSVTAQRIRTG